MFRLQDLPLWLQLVLGILNVALASALVFWWPKSDKQERRPMAIVIYFALLGLLFARSCTT
jgi:RsiW-degrading membrane proteinase PrsW (M82 family)